MKPGQVERIPLQVRAYDYVRNCACVLGYRLGRKYSVSIDRSAGIYNVTRTA